ncbi:MAG: acyltransferase [Lachnospiraceae bacterium]|nr:acyltransferase [Lachnospiraceae bacterium]
METKMKYAKRNINIECIRIIGCFMVVFLHTMSFNKGLNYYEENIIKVFVLNGVALFWMITGYFMFTSDKKYILRVKSTLLSIFIPAMLVILLTQLFAPWLKSQQSILYCLMNPDIDWKTVFSDFFSWQVNNTSICMHLWYVWAYMRLIIWFPLLRLLCKNEEKENKIRRGYLILTFLCMALNNIWTILQHLLKTDIKVTFFSPFDINIFYVLLGYEMYAWLKNETEIGYFRRNITSGKMKKISVVIILLMNMLLFGISMLCKEIDLKFNNFTSIRTVTVIIATVCIFYILMHIKVKESLYKIIYFIADKTFYIYLIHYMIIRKITTSVKLKEILNSMNGWLSFFIISLSAFLISLIAATLIKSVIKGIGRCLKINGR